MPKTGFSTRKTGFCYEWPIFQLAPIWTKISIRYNSKGLSTNTVFMFVEKRFSVWKKPVLGEDHVAYFPHRKNCDIKRVKNTMECPTGGGRKFFVSDPGQTRYRI